MEQDNYILKNLQDHPHWEKAYEIFNKLVNRGHCVYWAGGCVRDALLGREAKDLDLATDANPDEVLRLFPHGLEVGRKFGVIIVPLRGMGRVEITRFRDDGKYLDGRHPQDVTYSEPKEDALRRDFTINALFFDGHRVIDFVGGREDLKKGIIRCVGDPEKRFSEDYLRMLRAIRFSVELDFSIESQTLDVISQLGQKIQHISAERILVELKKMMRSPNNYEGLNLIKKTRLGHYIFGEVGNLLEGSGDCEFEKIKFILAQCSEKNFSLLLACLLLFYSDYSENVKASFDGRKYLDRFKLSNLMKKEVSSYISAIHSLTKNEDWLRAFQILDRQTGPSFVEFAHLFLRVNNKSDEILLQHRANYQRCCVEGGRLPQPLITGDDLLELGWRGALIGEALEFIYREQIDKQILSREELLRIVQEKYE